MSRDLPAVRLARFAIRGTLCLLTGIVILSGYSFAGRHAVAPPVLLPLTSIDRAIPLLPATVWIYHSLVVGIILSWFLVPNAWLGRRLLMGVAVSTTVCMAFFVYLPTGRYPVAITGGDAASRWALTLLRRIDDPSNCLPSLHVALTTSVALVCREFGTSRAWRLVPAWWAIAIAASTLTTKQHYAVDVVAGAVVGASAYAVIRWAARRDRLPFWCLGTTPIRLADTHEQAHLGRVQAMMKERAWKVEELPSLEATCLQPLLPAMVRFLSQVIYVEQIAATTFDFLARASDDERLCDIYEQCAADERRHADGLRRLLRDNAAGIEPPGLGCALVLDLFESLDPKSDADAMLVALSIPVFETFLDAGMIPFLRRQPALASQGLDALVANLCRDEACHLAVSRAVASAAVRSVRGKRLAGLRLFLNPMILRSGIATPFLAIDVYAHAKRLGFDFRTLLPSFRHLFYLHHGYPELRSFPIWIGFRFWVMIATAVTLVVVGIDRIAPRFLAWLAKLVPVLTDRSCEMFFSDRGRAARTSARRTT